MGELQTSDYADLKDLEEDREGGRFELLIRNINDVFGGGWAMFRAWRTDVDEADDAPVMGPETDQNTDSESSEGHHGGYEGTRVEGEYWRAEWINHQSRSVRVRGDADTDLPEFIIETDGKRMASAEMDNEDVGRWLWFRSSVVNELLGYQGFSLEWHTADTGCVDSTSGYRTHFGLNASDLITVYAYDVARLQPWEQRVWAAHNVVPEGGVSNELLAAQVRVQPASTHAPETILLQTMRMLEKDFQKTYGIALFAHDLNDNTMHQVSRFTSKDQASLLRLAKELIRVFSDRLNVRDLRKLSTHAEKEKLGSNKLLQDLLAQKIGNEKAREIFAEIAGTYDMRVGDAHPTGSKVTEAIKLAGIDQNLSFLRQGQQLISNFGRALFLLGRNLFT